jgi:hypothetical protein
VNIMPLENDFKHAASPACNLVWSIAVHEAQKSTHDCIESDHFVLGLGRILDLPAIDLTDSKWGEHIGQMEYEIVALQEAVRRTFGSEFTAICQDIRLEMGAPGRIETTFWSRTDILKAQCENAVGLARQEGREQTTLSDLFYALLTPPTGLLAKALRMREIERSV